MEVHVGEGGDGAPEVISCFLEVGARSVEHCLEGRADMEVDYFIYNLLNLCSRRAGLGKDIGKIGITYPVVVAGVIKIVCFAKGANEAEMKLGLFRHVPDDPGDLEELIVIIYHKRATDDIGAVEIAAGGTFIDYDRMRVVEGGIGVAGNHGQRENFEDCRVGKDEVMFEDMVVALPHQQVARIAEPDHLLDLRIGSDEPGAKKFGCGDRIVLGVIQVHILINPIDAVCIHIVAVVTELIRDVQDNQQTDAKTGSEANDVEDRITLVIPEASEGNL